MAKILNLDNPSHRMLWEQLRKERVFFAATLALMLLTAAFEGFGIGLLIPFLESLTSPDQAPFSTGIQWIDVHVLNTAGSPMSRLYRISLLILAAIWLRGTFEFLSGVAKATMIQNILHNLRCQAIDQLQQVSLTYFSKIQAGNILNTLTTEMQRLRRLFGIAASITSAIFLFLVYTLTIITLSWQMFLLAILFSLLLMVSLSRLIGIIQKHSHRITTANGKVAAIASEIIHGIRTIKAFCAEAYEKARFTQASNEVRKYSLFNNYRGAAIQPISQGIASTGLITMVIVAMQWLVLPGLLTTSTLLVVLFALFRLLPIVKQINQARGEWAHFSGSLDNVAQLLNPEDKPFLPDGTVTFPGLQDKIVFDHVSFAYEDDHLVLQSINLTIPKGKTIAIVGESGAGKSTLVDLIPRFYDPTEGRILMNGKDIRSFTLHSLRQHMAMVSQDTFLFNDTVRANIAYGLKDVPEQAIYEAAKKANALEFILKLPNGFDTILGDRAVTLSGGQRQRIAIARAILRDPEILILDEATSALDSLSEKLVQESLQYLMQNRTVVVIAHRLSTILNADKIVVMKDGKILEEGTYEELLSKQAYFHQLHNLQYNPV